MPEPDASGLVDLTANLVAGYLRGNPLPATELPDLIRVTHAALVLAHSPKAEPAASQQPAVSVKKSVRPHALVCLECGSEQKMLKRHLATAHGLTVEEYKTKWSLPGDYPMTAPEYASTRSTLAKKIGLGRNRKTPSSEPPAEISSAAEAEPGQKYPASRWSKPAR